MSDVGTKRNREYLVESLVEPSKTITEEFETVVVLDVDGLTHVGIKKASDDKNLTLITAEAAVITIPHEDIEDIRNGKSAMPLEVRRGLLTKGFSCQNWRLLETQ